MAPQKTSTAATTKPTTASTKSATLTKASPASKVSSPPKSGKSVAVPKPAGKATSTQAPVAKNERQTHGIYIANWGEGSVADVKAMFESAGNIVSARIRRRRYAIIFFETAAGVKKAIDIFNSHPNRDAKMTIAVATTQPLANPRTNSSVVFVSPVFRGHTSKQQLLDLFKGFKIERVRMYRHNYAYVYLNSADAAKKAIEGLNDTQFQHHKVTLELSTRSLAKDRLRHQKALLAMAH